MESKNNLLAISDYTEYPGPRYCNQGDFSGEAFYFDRLNSAFTDAYKHSSQLTIVLDGTAGYASSFLDQAFGNLIFDFSLNVVRSIIVIISNEEPDWKEMIYNETFIEWEERRIKNEQPKLTCDHKAWYRLVESKLKADIWIKK